MVLESKAAPWYKKAVVALARKILVIIYTMLKNNTDYDERIFDEVRKKQEIIRVKRIINEARKLGLEVTVSQI
ncbi:hypothetical protein TheetDRAFT_2977 [Thermoanaerobacter ethanolicus JW 200]|nr:hypothetical protein TheetDRAFT_2977 [Thermoanaerobacter ethanolicus JW 200]